MLRASYKCAPITRLSFYELAYTSYSVTMKLIDVTILAVCSYVCYNLLIIIARFKYKNILRLHKFYGGIINIGE